MTKQEKKKIFLDAFPSVKENDADALLELSEYVNTSKKKIVIKAGSLNTSVIFLIEGMLRGFFINENGEEKNIFLRPELTITGAPECLLKGETTKYTFEVMPRSKYLIFKQEDLTRLFDSNPSLMTLWVEALQENILTLIKRVESLIDKNPEKRYEELLKESPTFFQTAYNKHIANYLGMTSVSLSRIIKRKSSGN